MSRVRVSDSHTSLQANFIVAMKETRGHRNRLRIPQSACLTHRGKASATHSRSISVIPPACAAGALLAAITVQGGRRPCAGPRCCARCCISRAFVGVRACVDADISQSQDSQDKPRRCA